MSINSKKSRIVKQLGQITLLLLVCFLASGCISPHPDTPNKPALKKVILQLRWDHQYQFAGYYAAQWMEFYKEAGFDVEIRSAILPEGKILSATQEVENGHADFGIGAADILLARDQGQPLVVLAPIFQQSAAEFYARQDTPMQAPVDLLKLKVARNVNDLIDVELQAMLLSEGIDPQKITPYPLTPGTESITSGKVDVLPGYRISAPYEYQQLGISIKTLRPINYGIDFYGDTLFTRSEWVQRDPEAVERFIQASIKGWEYALDHPDEIAERITKELPRTASIPKGTFGDFNHFQIDGVKELTHYPVIQVGNNNPNRWQRMYDLMKKIGIVTHPLDLNSLIFDPEKLAQEREAQQKVILVALIVGVISITGLIFIWTLLLRKTVATKTRHLRDEIQKRKQSEQSLSESEEKHKTMVAQISDVIAIMSGDGTICYKSPNITRWFGWRPEDLVGTNGWETVHPDDLERMQKVFFGLLERDRAEKTVQYRYQCKDGSYKMIELTAVNLTHDPIIKGVLMNYHDITERKQAEETVRASEERYRLLYERSPLGYQSLDADGCFIEVNQSWLDTLGYERQEVIGHWFGDFLVPEMTAAFRERFPRFKAAGEVHNQFQMVHKDGQVLTVAFDGKIGYDAQGQFKQTHCVINDITLRQKMEEALQESEKRFRLALQNAPLPIMLHAEDGEVILINRAWTQLSGYTLGEIPTTTIWTQKAFGDRSQIVKDDIEQLYQLDQPEDEGEFVIRTKAGKELTWDFSSSMLGKLADGRWLVISMAKDVTERKEAEDKILFQASLLNAVGQAVIATDLDGKVIYFNQSAEKMYGWPASEAVGRNIIEVTVPKMAQSQAEEIMVSLREGHVWSGEFLVQRRDGTVFPVIVSDAPVHNIDGKLIGIVGVSADITERKKAEDDLRRIQLLLNETQRITKLGGWEFDPLADKVSWTDEVYRIHGLSKTYDPSRPDLDIQFYAPEDQQVISKAFNLAVEKGEPYDLELQLINAQGAKLWVRTIGQVERQEGKIVRVFGNIMDISERKRIELALKETNAILQAALDHSQAGIAIADAPDGRLRYVNKAGLAIPNRSEHELVDDIDINQYVSSWQILHFDGTPFQPDEVPLARAVLYGEKCSKEFIIRRANAEDRYVLANAGPILDDAGQVKAGIVVFLDITERRQTEEKLNAAYLELKRLLEEADESREVLLTVVEDQKIAEEKLGRLNDELDQRVRERTFQLEAANLELEAFAYSVSHDLRAPLRGIDGMSAALMEDYQGCLDEQGQHYLERIHSETQRMAHMIDDILKLSRITRVEMKLEPVNLTLLAQTILDRLQETESDRLVSRMINPDLNAFGDPNLLEIMLTNLLSNAWKFTGKQSLATIEFGRTLIADQPAFFIRDNGAGFDMAYAKNLFGAFQRMHKQSDFPGTGIGLATVQRIIHRHGGKVWGEAQKDQGATFYFTLKENG